MVMSRDCFLTISVVLKMFRFYVAFIDFLSDFISLIIIDVNVTLCFDFPL